MWTDEQSKVESRNGSEATPLDTDHGEGVSRTGVRTTLVSLMLCVIVKCVYQLCTRSVSVLDLSMMDLSMLVATARFASDGDGTEMKWEASSVML